MSKVTVGKHYWLNRNARGIGEVLVESIEPPHRADGDTLARVLDVVDGDRYPVNVVDLRRTRELADVAAARPRGRGRPMGHKSNPARQLGRVSDEDWRTLQEAARVSGESFTEFAVGTLLRRARNILNGTTRHVDA